MRLLKRIDSMMLKGFVGPFAVSFGIALFVLIMQFLWLYIDDIAGKGLSIFLILELLAYQSVAVIPLALPIAVLVSCVMLMGNLAERYELSSMKSSGLSLLRIMRGLIFCAAAIALFSYWCSDFLIPVANLQFKSRLYDIRKQKPALSIEPGVFNDDFRLFTIRVGKKARDGETIQQVLIEDRTNTGGLQFNQILSDSGQMYTTADKRFFVMHLVKGVQYQEPQPSLGNNRKQQYPFVRIQFDSWTKVWDLKEFEMISTDQDNFKSQRTMLSMSQLRETIDSLSHDIDKGKQGFVNEVMYKLRIKPQKPAYNGSAANNGALTGNLNAGLFLPKQKIDKPVDQYARLDETFAAEDQAKLYSEGQVLFNSTQANYSATAAAVESRRKEQVKSAYELYSKYSFALICFVFLFIGGPMGAIIRKGGFGYPILVSIGFFVLFVFLNIMFRKLSDGYFLPPFWAAMLPSILMMPVGAFLTRRAMNDAQLLNLDRFERLFRFVTKRLPVTT